MNEQNQIQPAGLLRQSTDVAGACREIVTRTAVNIDGRKYIKVEGYQAIATAHGCVASARDVEAIEGGLRAIGEVRRMDTGQVICQAEGFLGDDELVWFGGEGVDKFGKPKIYKQRPLYARRAMVQTRAISRACRSAFAHVVVLIDAGLSTTPAEEVPAEGFQDDHQPKALPAPAPEVPAEEVQDMSYLDLPGVKKLREEMMKIPGSWKDTEIHFGKNKGKKLGDLEAKVLNWYLNVWITKPYKGKWDNTNVALRVALDVAKAQLAEQEANQEGGAQ